MGGTQSSAAGSSAKQKLDELLFERGDDSLSVEVHNAEHEEDQVTVFSYFSDSKHKTIIDNCIQAHKTLRHPYILKYLTTYHSDGGVHIVTEAATPLSLCMEYVTGWEVTVGLSKLLQVLQFLHTQAGFSHNNISVESIFITPDGEWKLGRLDCVRKFSDNSTQHLTSVKALLSDDNTVPSDKEKLASLSTYCRDMKGVGHVCESLLEKLQDFGDQMTSNFSDTVDLMLSDTHSDIPPADVVASQSLLTNHLVTTLDFIEQITLKTPGEKQEFFRSLLDNLQALPEIVIAKMLVRPLLKRFVVEEKIARDQVLPKLLTPKTGQGDNGGLISTKLYKKYLPPVLYRLYTVKEFNIRLLLLQTFHSYCHLLDKTRLEKIIMPQILQGLHDRHDIIVSHTLMALSHLVPVLNGSIVIGTERRDTFTESSARAAKSLPLIGQSTVNHEDTDDTTSNGLSREDNANNDRNPVSPRNKPNRTQPPRKPRQPKPRTESKSLKLGSKKKVTDPEDVTSHPVTESVDIISEDRTEADGGNEEDESTPADHQLSNAANKAVTNSAGDDIPEPAEDAEQDFSDWDDFDDWDTTNNDNQSDTTEAIVPPSSQPTSPRHTAPSSNNDITSNKSSNQSSATVAQKSSGSMSLKSSLSKKPATTPKPKKINDDFTQLDIKASVAAANNIVSHEVDFFADMTPTIKTTKKSEVSSSADKQSESSPSPNADKKTSGVNLAFALQSAESDAKDGWGGEEDGWDW